jgi:molecular chaperone Hsp33
MTDAIESLGATDDQVLPFALENRPIRGRVVRMGPVLDDILHAHDYPDPVAHLLGEAVLIAILAGSSLKFEGRLIIQASGDGPVSLVLVDYSTTGGVRGYARYDEAALVKLDGMTPDLGQLMGKGRFALTIDPGDAAERYQGVVALKGKDLATSAIGYFASSEQLPTHLHATIARLTNADGTKSWRGGGAIMQLIAGQSGDDEAKDEQWDHVSALFETISADELTDPQLSAGTLLYRLFHEDGVRIFEGAPLHKRCPCTPDYLRSVLSQFPKEEHDSMTEEDGRIRMTCAFCSKDFFFTPEEISTT